MQSRQRKRGSVLIPVTALLVLFGLGALFLAPALGIGGQQAKGMQYDADGLPVSPVPYAEVLKHEEATLYYPGSTKVSDLGGDEYDNPFSPELLKPLSRRPSWSCGVHGHLAFALGPHGNCA